MNWEEKFLQLKQGLPEWDFLQYLPKQLGSFSFLPGGEVKGHELLLFAYGNPRLHRRLNFIYTKETDDFVPEREIGLNRYRDIRYFYREQEIFMAKTKELLPRMLQEIEPDFPPPCLAILRKEGILDWDYIPKLPARVGNFELFIHPDQPQRFINNAVLILDYSNFAKGDQLVFSYNAATNSYFAETKTRYIPNTIHDFDAANLKELAALLEAKLVPYLEKMSESSK